MRVDPANPLIVQSDRSLLLETSGPRFAPARDELARFAELVKSPEYIHTWRLSSLSLWNGAASGLTADAVVASLERWSKFPVPPGVTAWVRERMGRYGRLRLLEGPDDDTLILEAADAATLRLVRGARGVKKWLGRVVDSTHVRLPARNRGELKQALIKAGHPVQDLAGFVDGEQLDVALASPSRQGQSWSVRRYQADAVAAFLGGSTSRGEGGSGVVVLPCGAGKTIVGLSVLAELSMRTLILCTNTTALRQWRDEILDRTTLHDDDVAEYSGRSKDVGPVTLTTYQMLTHRRTRSGPFTHFGLFEAAEWGLIIYDEVHLLPAPVFRSVARIQARRRLGLTATLVREDGREDDVFALIGPKRFDVPWRDLERTGFIAEAHCVEVRVPMGRSLHNRYAAADEREGYRLASTNPAKDDVVEAIVGKYFGVRVIVIGMYLDQLRRLGERLQAPVITGETRQSERDRLFAAFRSGEEPVLLVSRVGNFSVDLPDARVAIQVSGSWGSRQEEAQRLGRVLRPKSGDDNSAWFYTVVTMESSEQEFADRRQRFLAEQGYQYEIRPAEALL